MYFFGGWFLRASKYSPGPGRRQGRVPFCRFRRTLELRVWGAQLPFCSYAGLHFDSVHHARNSSSVCGPRLIGYMAVEPYARRIWPNLMVSWQRILSGRFRDPLVGRDVLIGIFAGSALSVVFLGLAVLVGMSEVTPVAPPFGFGLMPSIGRCLSVPSFACFSALLFLGILSIMTGLLRRRWRGLAATGVAMLALNAQPNALDFLFATLFTVAILVVLTRVSLVAVTCFLIVINTLGTSPPLSFDQWYAGRALIALLIPLALLIFGWYVSLGGQPILGAALSEE